MLLENGKGAGGLMFSSDVVDRVASVAAPDPLTVVITLTRPDSRYAYRHLINHFGKGLFWLPEHVWAKQDPTAFNNYAEDGSLPVATGAWKIVRSNGQQIMLDRRDDWWGVQTGFQDLPDVQRVINIPKSSHDRAAQLLVAGDIDMSGDLVSAPLTKSVLESAPHLSTFSGREPPYGNLDWWPNSLYMNFKTGTWDDVRLRRALNYYVNAEQLVQVAYLGANPVSRTPFPAFGSMAPYIEDSLELADEYEIGIFDPAKGDALMEEMGYAKNANGMWEKDGATITGAFHGLTLFEAVGPIIAQQLRDAGIDVEFRANSDSRQLMIEGRTELSIFGHRGGVADPYDTLDLYHCKNALEIGEPILIMDRWCDEEYSAIVDQIGLIAPDDPQMRPLVRQAMEIWYENAVEVPMNQWVHRIPYNTIYWDNYPTEDNPYMQPAFWFASGQFSYVMHNLVAKNP
jgi:peptide/nickel transport system substrate-binding protein